MKEIIQKLAETGQEVYAKICEVTSVDPDNQTADLKPLDGSSDILDALLQVSDNGVYVEPKVGSLVACVFVSKELAVVVNHSEVKQFGFKIENCNFNANKDEIILKVDKAKFRIDKGEITIKVNDFSLVMVKDLMTLNGDSLGGLVKSEVVADDLKEIKKDLNNLKSIFTSWSPVPNDGGAVLKSSVSSWAGKNLEIKQKTDFENDKVKHGD